MADNYTIGSGCEELSLTRERPAEGLGALSKNLQYAQCATRINIR